MSPVDPQFDFDEQEPPVVSRQAIQRHGKDVASSFRTLVLLGIAAVVLLGVIVAFLIYQDARNENRRLFQQYMDRIELYQRQIVLLDQMIRFEEEQPLGRRDEAAIRAARKERAEAIAEQRRLDDKAYALSPR